MSLLRERKRYMIRGPKNDGIKCLDMILPVPNLNLTHFLLLAQQNDLNVLLRPGPYICSEWDNGGLPWWLLKYDGIQIRTYDMT